MNEAASVSWWWNVIDWVGNGKSKHWTTVCWSCHWIHLTHSFHVNRQPIFQMRNDTNKKKSRISINLIRKLWHSPLSRQSHAVVCSEVVDFRRMKFQTEVSSRVLQKLIHFVKWILASSFPTFQLQFSSFLCLSVSCFESDCKFCFCRKSKERIFNNFLFGDFRTTGKNNRNLPKKINKNLRFTRHIHQNPIEYQYYSHIHSISRWRP